jgi:peptidoglycan hydrolase CwlO-like protein
MADDAIEDRVERLETGQGKLASKIDEVLSLLGSGGKAHAAAEAHEEKHLDRPTTIEEQVRAELARKDAEAKTTADADAEKSERQTIKEQIAKLTESKPVAPQPRRQRVMWGER